MPSHSPSSPPPALRVAIAVMALLGAAKIADETLRLVWRTGTTAAIDLKLRHAETHMWFAGESVYRLMHDVTYPPATYAILWPFLGWLPVGPARWFWAGTTFLALAAMTWIILRESGAQLAWQRAVAALLLFAMNQTGVTIGNGQLILHVLPPLLAGLLLIHRGTGSWTEDLIAAGCVLFALAKVTLAAPFLWLVLLAPSVDREGVWPFRWRPTLLVAIGYIVLTMFAASFQPESVIEQLREWMTIARTVAERGGDYGNLSAWFDDVGLTRFVPLASTGVFIALGAWLYRYRRADVWIRLGVVAIITRLLTYHRVYDDVLVVLAFVALFRIAISSSAFRTRATALLAVSMSFMLLPARLGTSPTPLHQIFDTTHTLSWLATLVFFMIVGVDADGTRRQLVRDEQVHAPA